MQRTFSNALSEAVSKHITLSPTRQETLAWLAFLVMQHGTICLWRLAAHVATKAQMDSVRTELMKPPRQAAYPHAIFKKYPDKKQIPPMLSC